MSEANLEKYREFIINKQNRISRENHQRFKKAWKDFDKIVEMLIKKYNPQRIYQWGSLLNEDHFSNISDIDIAVEGVLNVKEYFKMFGDADEMTDFHLDLAQIEKVEPLFAKKIREKGRLVYERE